MGVEERLCLKGFLMLTLEDVVVSDWIVMEARWCFEIAWFIIGEFISASVRWRGILLCAEA